MKRIRIRITGRRRAINSFDIFRVRMGTYSDGEFERRLGELRDSQKEIQAISGWLVHHR